MFLHPLLVSWLPPARCLLPPHLHCIQTRHCRSHRSSMSRLQSRSKPQPRGRYSDLVLETGTGLLWETIQTMYSAEINIWRKSIIVYLCYLLNVFGIYNYFIILNRMYLPVCGEKTMLSFKSFKNFNYWVSTCVLTHSCLT